MTTVHVSHRGRSEELQEVMDQIDIESWLDREGVRYRHTRGSSGAQLNLKECPCCGNSNYKVFINAESGLGNCFSGDCETKFNKWKFISSYLGLPSRDVIEHVKQVAREQGWRPPRKKSMAANIVSTELKLPESIALPHGGRNLKYLDNRSITAEVAKYFELRFSHRGKFDYLDDSGRPLSQDYANRIIIPVFDLMGDLVSFQGRDITGTAEKKYLFPPGFATTGTHLHNGHNAMGAERVVIGEGVFDVAAIKIALDEESALRDVVPIGSFGKHLSHGGDNSQLTKLMTLKDRGLKQITIMWDAEKAAIEAAITTGLLLNGMGFVTRIALLPAGKDPNEVPASVVRAAFWQAEVITPTAAARLLLRRRA